MRDAKHETRQENKALGPADESERVYATVEVRRRPCVTGDHHENAVAAEHINNVVPICRWTWYSRVSRRDLRGIVDGRLVEGNGHREFVEQSVKRAANAVCLWPIWRIDQVIMPHRAQRREVEYRLSSRSGGSK